MTTSEDAILRVPGTGLRVPRAELGFRATRAGGPGGQNVNKVASRVEVTWDFQASGAPTGEQKARLAALSPEDVTATELAGEPITARLTEAPGNGARIGGLKVTSESAWFAARPSGTEDVYKIYAESFRGPDHLAQVQADAREVVSAALG